MEWRLAERCKTLNCCVCCGMPFASVGKDTKWSQVMSRFESVYAECCPRAGGCFDTLQEAHLMHKVQRDEGRWCLDDDTIDPESPDGLRGGDGEDTDEEEEEGAIQATPNSEGLWERMKTIDIDEIIGNLAENLVSDEKCGYKALYRDFTEEAEEEDYWASFYEEVVPACVRCNTLMTLESRGTELLIALGALDKNWFNPRQRSRSAKLRKYRYGMLIRKSVERARARLTPSDLVPDTALVQLMQTVFLALAANLACAAGEEDEADHFRRVGVSRLYNSAVMWVLCRIRWSDAFQTPFCHWHIHYAENMPLAQKRSFHQWLFGGHQFTWRSGTPSAARLNYLVEYIFQPAFLDLLQSRPNVRPGDAFSKTPTVWQLMRVCVGRLRQKSESPASLSCGVQFFFPPAEFGAWAAGVARVNTPTLDIGTWVQTFGPHVALRRMVACAVFNMPVRCAGLLLKEISGSEADAADCTTLLSEYQSFMIKHYEKVAQVCVCNLPSLTRAAFNLNDCEPPGLEDYRRIINEASTYDRVWEMNPVRRRAQGSV